MKAWGRWGSAVFMQAGQVCKVDIVGLKRALGCMRRLAICVMAAVPCGASVGWTRRWRGGRDMRDGAGGRIGAWAESGVIC